MFNRQGESFSVGRQCESTICNLVTSPVLDHSLTYQVDGALSEQLQLSRALGLHQPSASNTAKALVAFYRLPPPRNQPSPEAHLLHLKYLASHCSSLESGGMLKELRGLPILVADTSTSTAAADVASAGVLLFGPATDVKWPLLQHDLRSSGVRFLHPMVRFPFPDQFPEGWLQCFDGRV